jgi:multidrug efflux pump subunit AcrB
LTPLGERAMLRGQCLRGRPELQPAQPSFRETSTMIRVRLILILLATLVPVAGVTGLILWRTIPDDPVFVTVTAVSTGSTAAEVEQTIAAPIEQQLSGVKPIQGRHSRSWHDGSYRLDVSFAPGVDGERALVLVQDRVAAALPALPTGIQNSGVIVRKGSFGPVMIIGVISPDRRFDALQLSVYTKSKLEAELGRLPGVAEVIVLGALEYGWANLDGGDAGALAVYALANARPFDLRAMLQAKLEELRGRLADGVGIFAGFDLSHEAIAGGQDYLLLDVDLPVEAGTERSRHILTRCQELARQLTGVQHVLALSHQPFVRDPGQPCLVLGLRHSEVAPIDHRHLMREIRARFLADAKAKIRIRDLSRTTPTRRFGYPVAFALTGPDRTRLQELAGDLVARMSQDRRLTDVKAHVGLKLELAVDLDRIKAAALGLDPAEIFDSLRVLFGSPESDNPSRSRATWTFRPPVDAGGRANVEKFNQLKVRTRNGRMVPLTTVAAIRAVNEPTPLERIDLQPALSITANPAEGSTLPEAQSACEQLALEVLGKEQPAQYRLVWTKGR